MKLRILFLLILVSCATNEKVDHLENTKRLVKDGHQSLYKNGALKIPYTKVKLIAPGPDTIEITKNLVGIRAKESLLLALSNIQNTYGLMKAGAVKSYLIGVDIYKKGSEVSNLIDQKVEEGSYFLIDKSSKIPKSSFVESIKYSKKTTEYMVNFSKKLKKAIKLYGKEAAHNFVNGTQDLAFRLEKSMSETAHNLEQEAFEKKTNTIYNDLRKVGKEADLSSSKISKLIYSSLVALAKENLELGVDYFIQGYISFPEKVYERFSHYDLHSFSKLFNEEEERRSQYSKNLVVQLNNTINNYSDEFKKSMSSAKEESQGGVNSYGVTLGLIKSLGWLAKAVLWDATIKPIGEIGIYSLGYLATNSLIYPTMVVSKSGYAVTELAVELAADTTKTFYDLTAPSVVASVASVFSFLEMSAAVAGSTIVGTTGKFYNYSLRSAGVIGHSLVEVNNTANSAALKASSLAVKGTSKVSTVVLSGVKHTVPAVLKVTSNVAGELSEKSIRYIGVPLASVGIPMTGASVGVGVGVGGIATGATYKVAGVVASSSVYATGTILSGTTMTVGTAASILASVGLAGYESLKGVAVPSSYIMGSGLVLTYGNLTQLSAQTVLAASDLSYLVLSLEGPRWVLYGVKDKLNLGSKLGSDAIIDLNKLKKNGEEFESIPISEEEVIKVLNSF